ncbi:flagellin [Anaerosporobacter mobilis DSM 15930]|jgi:flagellin|uniref:Flagellin n=1 Tax=Anaerosporobacter mobilis DSM 15930 TaxID=1120996 RepID=A0A1M7MDP9_9FIRM|nr:flagellin [Anaerosporobacter mobilis]SHM88467.1 flagellin [Anaerosporobacter mobilis DSM 15930]
MRINHNISAIKANMHLNSTNSKMDKSLERLSSGFKINRAADDAAGMAISQKMRTQIAGLEKASNNASDGISVIQTAEGALSEVGAMLQRMRELAVQASNGTNTESDRKAVQKEIDQLNEEIQRISDTTEFNTKKLLNGDIDRKSYSSDSKVNLVSLSDSVGVGSYVVKVAQLPTQTTTTATNALTNGGAGSLCLNGEEIEILATDTSDGIFEKIRNLGDSMNIEVTRDAGNLKFTSKEFGSDHKIEIQCGNNDLATKLGFNTTAVKATRGEDAKISYGAGTTYTADVNGTYKETSVGIYASVNSTKYMDDPTNPGTYIEAPVGATATHVKASDGSYVTIADATLAPTDISYAKVESQFSTTATMSSSGKDITITDQSGFSMKIEVDKVATIGADIRIDVLSSGPMMLQIGANEGQTMEVRIPQVTPKTLGIDNVNMTTQEGAEKAITQLDSAITEVSAIRAKLGAYQNRLEHSIANLDTTGENMTEALSRVEDTDMAEEMAQYTQMQVLSQAGTSMLAQANQRPQTILSLLQG